MSVRLLVEHFADVDTWPSFTNSDEICISCDKSPGSEGCKLGGKITIERKKFYYCRPFKFSMNFHSFHSHYVLPIIIDHCRFVLSIILTMLF